MLVTILSMGLFYFIIVLLIYVPVFFVMVNFFYSLSRGVPYTKTVLWQIFEMWSGIVIPCWFLISFDMGKSNDCCYDSAIFSPPYRTAMYVFIGLCMVAFIISVFRRRIFPPAVEGLLNLLLLAGLILNIVLSIHLHPGNGWVIWLTGNVPVIMLLLMNLVKNERMLREAMEADNIVPATKTGKWIYRILQSKPLVKYPVLFVLLVPLLMLFSLFLLVFGQKPDALVRTFTDTYKHGLSQLDYMCDNVQCGGHFLCSVGANGHRSVVKPVRFGERNGNRIVCTRQLLVSNAFEELLEEKCPSMHRVLRRNYNRVGSMIHRYYGVFRNKLVCDIVYFVMKPAEWIFVIVLYSLDYQPESRINRQYTSRLRKDK